MAEDGTPSPTPTPYEIPDPAQVGRGIFEDAPALPPYLVRCTMRAEQLVRYHYGSGAAIDRPGSRSAFLAAHHQLISRAEGWDPARPAVLEVLPGRAPKLRDGHHRASALISHTPLGQPTAPVPVILCTEQQDLAVILEHAARAPF